jgi:uncharacterized protein YecE (DUF72 family)
MTCYIGTAGWSVPNSMRELFPQTGSHLQRYSSVFNAVEVNTSFYKDHLPKTYERWAQTVPEDFRFSVKLSKYFTHERCLNVSEADLILVLDSIFHLGDKLGALLVQLPPSLTLEAKTADIFFASLRKAYSGLVAFEPRHISWISPEGLQMMKRYHLSKVFADPAPCPLPDQEALSSSPSYYRLHGSPEIYRSAYDLPFVSSISEEIKSHPGSAAWCIFDNTTFGWSHENAYQLQEILME